MPKAAAPTIFFAKRVHHRNEVEGLEKAAAMAGWRVTNKAEAATAIWDVRTLADVTTTEPLPGQLINWWPGMLHCCRKGLFAHLISRLRALLPPGSLLDDGKFIPPQWALPRQVSELAAAVEMRAAEAKKRGKPAPVYIVKPDAGSQGDGIVLTSDPCKTSWDASKERVVQQYLVAPLLLDGLKFDLRLYVLVTSTCPLRVFLFREGLARFAVDAYVEPTRENMRNAHMHLTNYSLNKKCENFKHSDAADGGDDGSKRTASSVFAALKALGQVADVEALWEKIGALVRRSLTVLQPVFTTSATSQPCFQILGFDVLLDSKVQPWLLEMNDHPSIRIDLSFDEPGQYSMNGLNSIPSPVDEAIKVPMLAAALRVVAHERGLRARRRRKRQAAEPHSEVDDAPDELPAPGKPSPGRTADDATDDATDDAMDDGADDGADAGADAAMDDVARFASGGAHGTGFYELPIDAEDEEGFALISRLTALFVRHTPPSVRREESGPRVRSMASSDPLAVPGPRWKGTAPFVSFLQAGGLLPKGFGGGLLPKASLSRPDVDIIVLSVCGKGGSMDVVDFSEACAKVARRVWPDRADAHPSELLIAFLDTFFPSECV